MTEELRVMQVTGWWLMIKDRKDWEKRMIRRYRKERIFCGMTRTADKNHH